MVFIWCKILSRESSQVHAKAHVNVTATDTKWELAAEENSSKEQKTWQAWFTKEKRMSYSKIWISAEDSFAPPPPPAPPLPPPPPRKLRQSTLSPRVPWEMVMFIMFAKRQFIRSVHCLQHHLHLRTWWWETICKRHVESIRHKDYESFKKSQPSCLKFLEAKRGEGQQDIMRAEAMMCDLLVVKTCNHHNPWIFWCF